MRVQRTGTQPNPESSCVVGPWLNVSVYSRAQIADLVGPGAMARGEVCVQQGLVLNVARGKSPSARAATRGHQTAKNRQDDGSGTLVGQVKGTAVVPYVVVVELASESESLRPTAGRCSCPVRHDCKHVAAVLLTYLERAQKPPSTRIPSRTTTPALPAWERTLAPLIHEPTRSTAPARWNAGPADDVALQVDVITVPTTTPPFGHRRMAPPSAAAASEIPPRPAIRLAMRPVTRGASGRWIRTGMSWRDVSYAYDYVHTPHLDLLRSLYALAAPNDRSAYYDPPTWIYADDAPSVAFWALIAEAERVGLPLIEANREQTPVIISRKPTRVVCHVTLGRKGALNVRTTLEPDTSVRGDATDAALASALKQPDTTFIGRPPAGIAGRSGANDQHALVLSPLTSHLESSALELVDRTKPVVIPPSDATRFLTVVLPTVRAHVDEVICGPGVNVPEAPAPTLTLLVTHRPGHRVTLTWQWRYADADGNLLVAAPLGSPEGEGLRDQTREAELVHELGPQLPWWPYPLGLLATPVEPIDLEGMNTAQFVTDELPALQQLADSHSHFAVLVEGEATDYRVTDDVTVSLQTKPSEGDRDWFDLDITVTAGDRDIPFVDVFAALARNQEYLLLDDGLHFSLMEARFTRLRELIDEARQLQDSMGRSLRVNRYHAGLFDELEALGVVGTQAEAWRRSLGALATGAPAEAIPAPEGFRAEMRGYQQEGFEWLAFRHQHQLGGVLADDMGLGKTIQALALILHARRTGSGPFLVVAPTSVVGNWVSEAAKFTPTLRTVSINETAARRRQPLTEAVAGADIVVTSYALFRLEFDSYDAQVWGGFILDEAQFVKNHQSVGYQCARRLRAPFKLALTGTPLENNLLELWSILSIVCPGLFGSPSRFSEYYGKPIERDHDAARLDQLRRRIAPFVLRRTKEAVATDLPEKLEHVTDVTLNPRHRKIYDQYLQRERTKVLGLVDDLDNHRFEVFRSLAVLRQASLDVSLVDDAHTNVPSSKLDVLFEMLDDIIAEGHSVLIFSQFTRFLGKVRDRLTAHNIDHAYLDGRTRRRAEQIERFTSGEVPIFLISLKAGGFGLNLTAADYCILLDPWWNPAAEAQAVDRAHRIGQDRNVMVYRLVSQHTIEEKVMALKATKSTLFAKVVDGAVSSSNTSELNEQTTTKARAGLSATDVRDLLS